MAGVVNVSVPSALLNLSINKDMINYIKDNRAVWASFGKKNSHMYRTELFTSMSTSKLNPEAQLMVLFFFSVIKNRDRVLKAMGLLDAEMQKADWFVPAKGFIESRVVQYVTQAERQNKFPAVNIPTCMPGFDILVWSLMSEDKDRTVDNACMRTTFSQLTLNQSLQAKAKAGYAYYWKNIVVGTNNPEKKEAPMMRDQYYANSESDKYKLIKISEKNKLEEVNPNDEGLGYTEKEMNDYFRLFDNTTVAKENTSPPSPGTGRPGTSGGRSGGSGSR